MPQNTWARIRLGRYPFGQCSFLQHASDVGDWPMIGARFRNHPLLMQQRSIKKHPPVASIRMQWRCSNSSVCFLQRSASCVSLHGWGQATPAHQAGNDRRARLDGVLGVARCEPSRCCVCTRSRSDGSGESTHWQPQTVAARGQSVKPPENPYPLHPVAGVSSRVDGVARAGKDRLASGLCCAFAISR